MHEHLFDRLMRLVGRRADDPDLRAFHDEEGLAPPPVAFPTLGAEEQIANKGRGYRLVYRSHLRRAAMWPPRLEQGKLVPYLAQVEIRRGSDALPPGIPPDLDEAAARAMELFRREAMMAVTVGLIQRDERTLEAQFSRQNGRLLAMRLLIDELDPSDPRVPRLSREEEAALEREARVSAAGWDPTPQELRCTRSFPARSGPVTAADLPPSLADLRALTDAGQLPGVDLLIHAQRKLGEVTGWTNNPDAEPEFFAFGADGRGSVIALWLVHDAPLEQQPVVFLGSEGDGDVHPLSSDLSGFLELLAAGIDLASRTEGTPVAGVSEILDRHFPGRSPRTGDEIFDDAQQFKDIDHRMMRQLNRHV